MKNKEIQMRTIAQMGLILSVIALFMAFYTSGVTAQASSVSSASSTLNLNVKSAIAIDANTGQVLYDKNDKKALPIASMTKLLAIYIVLQEVHDGKLSWNQKVHVNQATAKLSKNTELTNVPLTTSETYTVKELYQASLIYSANAAVVALGNEISGSPHAFMTKMRQTAKKLGLNSAKLITASGITNGQAGSMGYSSLPKKDENTMSASDVAKLAQDLLKTYPEILKTTSTSTLTFDKGGASETKMTSWDLMLKGLSQYSANLPVDGLKTGSSTAAGANFVGTVKKNGHRIITVVMHAAYKSSTDPSRFVQTKKLMNWVYATYKPVTLKKGAQFAQSDTVSVPYGKQKTTTVAVGKNTTVWLAQNQSTARLKGKAHLKASVTEKKGLKAPLAAGTQVGTLNLKTDGQSFSFLNGGDTLNVPIQINHSLKRANWFVRTWRDIAGIF